MNFAIAPQLNIIAHIFSDYMPLFLMCNWHRRRRRHLHRCVIVRVFARILHPRDDSNHYQKFIKMSVCLCTIHFRYGLICFSQYEALAHSFYGPLLFPIFFFSSLAWKREFVSIFFSHFCILQKRPFNWSRGTKYISIGAAFNQGHSINIRSLCISSIFHRFSWFTLALAHSVSFAIRHMGMARKVYSFRFSVLMTFWKSNQNFKSVTNLCRHTLKNWSSFSILKSQQMIKQTNKQNRADSNHFNYSKSFRIEALNVNKRKWNRDFLANVIDVNCHVVSEIEYEIETETFCPMFEHVSKWAWAPPCLT